MVKNVYVQLLMRKTKVGGGGVNKPVDINISEVQSISLEYKVFSLEYGFWGMSHFENKIMHISLLNLFTLWLQYVFTTPSYYVLPY